MAGYDITVTADDEISLIDLFDGMVERAEELQESSITFSASAKNSPHTAAGLPEITEFALGLATARTFTVLVGVLKEYFHTHPKGKITFRTISGDKEEILTAENVSSKDFATIAIAFAKSEKNAPPRKWP
jgi:hypothetical protein